MSLAALVMGSRTCVRHLDASIGGVIGGCFVPVLVLVLWLSGAFGPKCPSPFAKKPKPDATSDAGIQVNVSR